MKINKVIGVLLLVLAVTTIIGMILKNDAYWLAYNYATITLSLICGVVLLKQE